MSDTLVILLVGAAMILGILIVVGVAVKILYPDGDRLEQVQRAEREYKKAQKKHFEQLKKTEEDH